MNKRIIVVLIFAIAAGALTIYFFFSQKKEAGNNIKVSKQELTKCLDENKKASYNIAAEETVLADLIISVNDKSTKKELSNFKIDNVYKNYSSIELRSCNVYVIRFFNYDPQKTKQEPGFKVEIWRYQYNGDGGGLLLLSEKQKDGSVKGDYSYDFRIDTDEKYVVLERGYLGRDDYALVIKDIKTKHDVFVLLNNEISKNNPNVIGGFNMRGWSKNSKYFWGDIFDGAYVLAYFRIDTQNWKSDIFEAPEGAMGGFPLNINTGYVSIQPGQIWTGDYQLTQELKEQYRKEGKKSQLYLYNLFTKEKILIETVDEPLFSFKSKWLSDAELEYELPTGEKKIYKINEK